MTKNENLTDEAKAMALGIQNLIEDNQVKR